MRAERRRPSRREFRRSRPSRQASAMTSDEYCASSSSAPNSRTRGERSRARRKPSCGEPLDFAESASAESIAHHTILPTATGGRQRACRRSRSSASEAQPAKILAVTSGAERRRAEARQHVLFDDDPATVVAARRARRSTAAEWHRAAPELAEDAACEPRCDSPTPSVRARAAQRRFAVLEVHVPDAVAVPRDGADRIAAAVRQMPGVEAQAEQRRIRCATSARRSRRRLDVAGAVMMEHGA